jgi:hypothetical protein
MTLGKSVCEDGQTATLLTCIRNVAGSNRGGDAAYPHWVFSWFYLFATEGTLNSPWLIFFQFFLIIQLIIISRLLLLRLYILFKYATFRPSFHLSINLIRQILQILLPDFGL